MNRNLLATVSVISLLTLIACDDEPPWQNFTDGGSDSDADSDADSDSDTDTDPPPECDNLPPTPVSITELNGPRGYHGLAFDKNGYIYGMDMDSLVKATYQGQVSPFAPNLGWAEGMVFTPDNYLVVLSGSGVIRIDENGSDTFVAYDEGSYGLTLGPDGLLYAAGGSDVYRINHLTGDREVLFTWEDFPEGCQHRVVNFSPNNETMYIASLCDSFEPWEDEDQISKNNKGGILFSVELDAQLNPIGSPEEFATNVGDGWHDGLEVDACGNLYVADYFTTGLYRVTPQGEVSLYHDWSDGAYGHGIAWGTGDDGWKEDAIYLPQPYDNNTVVEVVVGITGS